MPYKDKEKKTQRQRERRLKPLQGEVPTIEAPNETPHNDYSAAETDVLNVPASYVPGTNGKQYLMLPERSRYLVLSDLSFGTKSKDGQVLDRANQPTSTLTSDAMLRANDNAFGYVPNVASLSPELRRRFALKPAGKAV